MIDVTIVRRACLLGVPLVLPEKYRKLVTYSHDVTRPSSQSTNKREKQAEPMSMVCSSMLQSIDLQRVCTERRYGKIEKSNFVKLRLCFTLFYDVFLGRIWFQIKDVC